MSLLLLATLQKKQCVHDTFSPKRNISAETSKQKHSDRISNNSVSPTLFPIPVSSPSIPLHCQPRQPNPTPQKKKNKRGKEATTATHLRPLRTLPRTNRSICPSVLVLCLCCAVPVTSRAKQALVRWHEMNWRDWRVRLVRDQLLASADHLPTHHRNQTVFRQLAFKARE